MLLDEDCIFRSYVVMNKQQHNTKYCYAKTNV